jgi:cyclophilin family peptidyl-prolyl cis-trans isomerase
MSISARAALSFVILAVIAACGQQAILQPGKSDARPLAQIPAAQRANYYKAAPPMTIDPTKKHTATITTNKGNIVVALDAGAAPQTVNNFVFLANQGFYDGLKFHRVEPGFVIQGGDPLGQGTGGPGYTIPGEFKLKHVEGAIAMARLSDQANPKRDSSGSQFYITLAPTPFLDGAYTAFGQVTQGLDVVKKIAIGDTIQKIVISVQ